MKKNTQQQATLKQKLIYLLLKIFYNPKIFFEDESIQGRDLTEPMVIICNHTRKTNKYRIAEADGPLIRYAFRNKNACSLTAKDILAKTPWKYLSKNLDCIPVERFSASTKWLHDCLEKIKEGKSVIIFPEGTTLKSQEISGFQSGFLLLAKTANVRVLPVVIYRTFGLQWRRPKIKIGVPYTITDKKLTKSIRQEESKRFQEIIIKLYCDLTGKTAKEATKEQAHNYKIFNDEK